jgi:hypothetical protein
VEQEYGRELDEINAVWFTDAEGCYPMEYAGDDLLNDIHTKFYCPLGYLRHVIEQRHPEIPKLFMAINVDPSYEDTTRAVMHAKNHVLIKETQKAWNHFWETDKDFNAWVRASLTHIEKQLLHVQEFPLFVINYHNLAWQSDGEPVLCGFLAKAPDLKTAETWAKTWERNCNNVDAEIDLDSVQPITHLADLEKYPSVFVNIAGVEA